MMLTNPDARRGLRAVVEAIVAMVLLWFAWEWVAKLDANGLREGMRWALGIVGLGELGYVMENTTRAFKFQVGPHGVDVDAGGDPPAPQP